MKFNTTILLSFLIVFASIHTSCTKKIYFQSNNDAKDFNGFMKVNTDKNKNYNLKLKFFYLEDIDKILENKKTYAIWMQNIDSTKTLLAQFQKENKNRTEINKIVFEKPTKIFISEQMQANSFTPAVIILTLTY